MNMKLETYLDLLGVPGCLAELKNQIGAHCSININQRQVATLPQFSASWMCLEIICIPT